MWKAVFLMLSDKGTVRILQLGCDRVLVEAHPVQLREAGKKLDFLIFSFPVMKVHPACSGPTVPLLLVLDILTRGKVSQTEKNKNTVVTPELWRVGLRSECQ